MFHPSRTKPLWNDSVTIRHFSSGPQTRVRDEFDVVVIGAGITGLTAAWRLKQAGKRVAVLDLERLGQGETGHTTAHLTEVLDLQFPDLIANFGEDGAKLALQAARASIDLIETTARELDADCQFQRVPGYRYAESADEAPGLRRDFEAARRLGVDCELASETPLPFPVAQAFRVSRQAQFHPLRYLARLAEAVHGDGSEIFEETRALDVEEKERCIVHADKGEFRADRVIVAANVPVLNRFSLHPKLAAYRTYAMALELEPGAWRPEGLYWDAGDPYHYARGAEVDGTQWLIVGGEDHKTGQGESTEMRFQKLDDWARERFDVAKVGPLWSGQVINSVDGLPFIGLDAGYDRVYVSTGYAGNGLTWGTLGGALTADLALGRDNPYAELFDARRFKPLASARAFLSENIDFPSHLIGDRIGRAAGDKMDVLRENEGAIVRVGAKKVAAYRDPQGNVHLLSPVCPHLGCYVAWNDAEKSWDCPCHGSRFDPLGKVVNGPAVADLAPEDRDDDRPFVLDRIEGPEAAPSGPFASPLLSMFACPLRGR